MKSNLFDQEVLPIGPLHAAEVFSRIRNYLAGRHLGATRDGALLDQVLLCLFARLHLSQEPRKVQIQPGGLKRLYIDALDELKQRLGEESLPQASVSLDAAALEYVDRTLSLLDLSPRGGDLVGDAYQCFLGSEMRGKEGQFFTPTTAVTALLQLVQPRPGEKVIDPACGAGGFLFATARQFLDEGVKPDTIQRCLFGVDKDGYLARLARMRVSLLTLRETKISVGDSLAWHSAERHSFMSSAKPGAYDVVLTNPPFGTRIISASDELRKNFALAHRWVTTNNCARLVPSNQLQENTPPQVLFVERCISLVRPGGRIGMVVPESLVSGRNYRHVVEFILRHTSVEAVIGMPEALFKTSGKGGTHTKTALIYLKKEPGGGSKARHHVFMAEAAWCGHDSRGRPIPKNDVPSIVANYRLGSNHPKSLAPSPLGYALPIENLREGVLAPRAYDPEIPDLLKSLDSTHLLVSFERLVDQGVLSLTTGDEVGKLAYGTGDVPFVRTSDLSNWEIKIDPKHAISRTTYETLKAKQDVQAGDILLVRDGTYLIGTCAIITKYDVEIVFQSHLYKIRVGSNELLDPFLLLAILSSSIAQRQIKAFTRTMDIIDSLGNRILEVVLPVPKDPDRRRDISRSVQKVIDDRIQARELTREIIEKVLAPGN